MSVYRQGLRLVLLTMAALVLGFHAAVANADTIHVPDDYPTIQEALFAAHDGDVIIVADGVWTGPYNKNIDFGGLAVTLQSENGPENCIIDCEGDGRGFYFRFGEGPDSVVDGFTITNGNVSYGGGGVYCLGSSPTITNCVISGNLARYCGGGICCDNYSSSIITNCMIVGNTASQYGGGGVYCYGSSPVISNCVISWNVATYNLYYSYGGGIYCDNYSSPTITNCMLSNNSAHYGGGVCCYTSDPTIINCIISRNSVDWDGGGACHWGGSPTIINCTFSGNSAGYSGGGIYTSSLSARSIVNCILWGDTAPRGPELGVIGGMTTITFSDVEGGWAWIYGDEFEWGEGSIVSDPLFVDPDNSDYHLSADSPCIDAGDPYFIPELDERDIDGQMRVWDGDEDGQWIVDMGSDEYGSQAPGDLNGDGCVDHADLGVLLSDWGCTGGDCPGDCDFDGDTDHADLGTLLGHWGEGC